MDVDRPALNSEDEAGRANRQIERVSNTILSDFLPYFPGSEGIGGVGLLVS
jgi:hypothetical protein